MSEEVTADEKGAMANGPSLRRVKYERATLLLDVGLRSRSGIIVAFSEKTGGVSRPPYSSLNLAAHVEDDPADVDANRGILLDELGLASFRDKLTTAEQVHGAHVHVVTPHDAGSGARAQRGRPSISATDVLVTIDEGIPLLMLYADCVPIILVAEEPRRGVAVVHSGWRGTHARVVEHAAKSLLAATGSTTSDLLGYVGPHIGACCYEVDERTISQFCNSFDTITAVDGHLDLESAVIESMTDVGMLRERIATVSECTRDHADRFFSYRAHRVTGRHGALAVIEEVE